MRNVGLHYDRMLHNIDCVRPHEVQYFPRSNQCLDFEPLKGFVDQDAPDRYQQGWEDTTQLDTVLRETVQNIREAQATHRLSLYNMLVSGGHVSKKMGQEKALSLAKAVFRLGEDWCYELRFGHEVMAEDRKDYRHRYMNFYRDSPVKVYDEGVFIVQRLQVLLGLDEKATIRDMDTAGKHFICSTCKPKTAWLELKKGSESRSSSGLIAAREVLSWRKVVRELVRRGHSLLMYPDR